MPTFRNPTEGSNSDMESERGDATPLNDTVYSRQSTHETKGWDVFRDLPQDDGASDNAKMLEAILKVLKVFAYLFTFICVLLMAVIAKASFFFMTSQIKPNKTILLCKKDLDIPDSARDKDFYVIISDTERIAWIWVIFLAAAIPEVFSLFRSWRLCIFKSYKTSSVPAFLMVMLMETLHTIGLTMLLFLVLPNLNAIKGIMLTNCVCFVPGILGLLSRHREEKLWFLKVMLDIVAIVAQLSGFFLWPILDSGSHSWAIPVSIFLISVRWWENFIDKRSPLKFIQYFAKMKDDLRYSRYFVHSFVGVWKLVIMLGTMCGFIHITMDDVSLLFSRFFDSFSVHSLKVFQAGGSLRVTDTTIAPDIATPAPLAEDIGISSNPLIPLYFLLVQVSAALLCYVFGKFACKICIQGFSFAFPVCLTVPVTISVIITGCGIWQDSICIFRQFLPNYLFWECLDGDFLGNFITRDYAWIWLIWLLSQTWITLHIWTPKCERLASTEKLFLSPMFVGVLIDQSLAMNRLRDDEGELRTDQLDLERDGADEVSHYYDTISIHTEASNSGGGGGTAPHIKSKEHITQIYVCATMWHETPDEMADMLKSVIRLDEDQSARRNAQKYLRVVDPDYYEFEVHIFFDDAFEISDDNEDENVVNRFVKQLVEVMDSAASHVHQCQIRLKPPKKLPTPYGGRLSWVLPGKNKLVAHLKDKSKIRHRKRWSQVMYMYYLLGHRLMELPIDVSRKATMAENTYLLTLDGDIDFQPNAVQLLVDLMKKNRNLGAACGRIHPVGSGPMQWYQLFEYAIGHWLQKATEHMIGCVLCSPGCFSMFRGKALMDDNVMRRYTTRSDEARHYVQYDQGEDRWLCTLLLQRGYRVEYSAASDAYTHCPEGFGEFYNQRRRWVPSTMANIMDLLTDYKHTVKVNDNISVPYIAYQMMLMGGTVLGPGTIFLMLLGAFVAAFRISNWISFVSNIVPILAFMFVCFVFKAEIQLMLAQVMSAAYALLMMAVLVGTALQLSEDGIGSPSAIFLIALAGSFFIAAVLHPQEFWCVVPGLLYLLLIPSMYLLLIIYSLINLNVVSWGTREVQTKKTKKELEEERKEAELNRKKQAKGGLLGFLSSQGNAEEDGSISFSFANLFTCIFCTYPKSVAEKTNIIKIGEQLEQINKKVSSLERALDSRDGISRRRSFSKSSVRGADMLSTVGENEEPEDGFDMSSEGTESEKLEPKQERDDLINPYWIEDKSLKRGEVEYLPEQEIRFWKDLLEKYLYPIDQNKEHQARIAADLIELRNKSVFAFFMFNALFILIVFLLQLNKENLHVDWPLGVKTNITYIEETSEIRIQKEYLQLEPIGLVFVFFFALILIIQFTAMLFHRFGTLSHILASIELSCFSRKVDDISDDAFIDRNAIQIARNLQRLRGIDDDGTNSDDDNSTGPGGITRRKTIYKLEKSRKQKNPIGTLDVAFKKRFMSIKDDGGETQTPVLSGMRKASVRRQTLSKALAHRRNTVFAEKSKMKTLGVKNEFVPNQHKRDSLTRAQRLGSLENVFSEPKGDKVFSNGGYANSSDEDSMAMPMHGYSSGRGSRASKSHVGSIGPRGTNL